MEKSFQFVLKSIKSKGEENLDALQSEITIQSTAFSEKIDSDSTCTLRIKSFPVQSAKTITILLQCLGSDTINHVFTLVSNLLAPFDKSEFEIRSLFPNKTHLPDNTTLAEANLIPNANLILHKTKQ